MNVKAASTLLLLTLAAQYAAATACAANIPAMNDIMQMLQTIGYPIGIFMVAYMGIKWMLAEGPQDRENARRGIIYVVIGLILLQVSVKLVYFLLCF